VRTSTPATIDTAPRGWRRGVSLLETSIVLVVLAILMTVTLPAMRPSEAERLRGAADLLAADLRLAQSLAIRDATNYTLTPTTDGWKIEHTGTGVAPALPTPALGGTGTGYQIKLPMLVGRPVALTGRLADSGAEATSVTFTPTGGTTASQSVVIWLTTGAGGETRSLPVGVTQVTGRAAVGDLRTGAPPAVVAGGGGGGGGGGGNGGLLGLGILGL